MEDNLSFQYANKCLFEVHCSPFGVSGIFLKLNGTNILGFGSTMGLITGTTEGYIHYNDGLDMAGHRYRLFVVVSDDGVLRIDFTKIPTTLDNKIVADAEETEPSLIFVGRCPEGRPDNVQPFIGIFSFDVDESDQIERR